MGKNLIALSGIALVALTLPLGFGDTKTPLSQTAQAAQPQSIASGTDLYCAGYISAEPINTKLQIISGEERTSEVYSPSTRAIYLSQGVKDGVKVGDVYTAVRPKGKFRNEYSKKSLGHLNQEVGVVRVIAAHESTATAEVVFACEDLKKGDRLIPFEKRPAPQVRTYKPLDRYGDIYGKSGALLGQLVAIRHDQATASERSIVHLDLGADDGVKAGDYFTVLTRAEGMTLEKFTSTRSSGAVKVSDEGDKKSKEMRPLPPRVAGELAVIHVEKKSATAVVTRQVAEIMAGDFVQRQ